MPNSNIHNLLEQAVIAVSGMSGPSLPPGLLPASAWQQRGQKGIFGKGDEGRQLEPAPLVKKKNKRRGQPRPRKPRRCAATASAASAASAEGAAAAAIGADAAEEAEEPPEEEEEEEEEEESADEDVADPNDEETWAAMLASTAEEAARQEDAARPLPGPLPGPLPPCGRPPPSRQPKRHPRQHGPCCAPRRQEVHTNDT